MRIGKVMRKMADMRSLVLALVLVLCSAPSFADGQQTYAPNQSPNDPAGTYQQPYELAPADEGIRVYRDPESGDRVISVRSRLYNNQQNQQIPRMPIYVEPYVRPY